jgi:hypothetical protein
VAKKKLPTRAVPKPMTPEEKAFVGEVRALRSQGTKPSNPKALKPSMPVTGRNLVPRADGSAMRRIAAYFPPALAKRLELHCVQIDRDMSDVIVAAVEAHLKASGH